MTKLLKTAAIAALITGFANSAMALEVTNPLEHSGMGIETLTTQTCIRMQIRHICRIRPRLAWRVWMAGA